MCLTLLLSYLKEDQYDNDITTNLTIPLDKVAKATIISKSDGFLAGVKYAKMLFEHFKFDCTVFKEDGSEIHKNDKIIDVSGSLKTLLAIERTVVNILMRMSGVATETKKIISAVSDTIKIAGTRKTVPGFRYFDKKAIEIAGGRPHRHDLSSDILIKENHLVGIEDIHNVILDMKNKGYSRIEVEAETAEDALRFTEAGADIVMLDNFSILDIKKTLNMLHEKGVRKNIRIEISGNITSENIHNYVGLDIDIISLGYLTHSARCLDFSLRVKKESSPIKR